ncbi:flagellar export chaperone FliS [Calderihabitans maritimus]|uniref:Flagellar secretion chaperone FliS n=1 Tax=Calderihabitans maritimus TaxID=1246530 RepID=A0A1Z5HUA2_9FIRM|nr:flagellar export chaperone FliS [Calderihabitans maritimus]GAW92911.1 flagellar protein FliS [Calderihabitans maritimus]
MQLKAYQAYQKNQIETLSQEKLVLMLYEGIIRFAGRAQEAVRSKRYDRASYYLGRAQDILLELMVNLNREAGEVAENLFSLYEYMHWRLVQANIKKDESMIAEVVEIATELTGAWKEAIKTYQTHNYTTNGVNVSG